jgi:hypothetical protein
MIIPAAQSIASYRTGMVVKNNSRILLLEMMACKNSDRATIRMGATP